jgi:hypothetical protein
MLRWRHLLLIAILILPAAVLPQTPQTPQTPLRVNVDLINVSFSVTDRLGRFVPGLKQEDFAVEEDGRKQDITRFSHENELPLTL